MLTALSDVAPLSAHPRIVEPAPSAEAVAELLEMLSHSVRPLILVGGCNWTDAGRAGLQSFAEASDIPVVAAFRFNDRFDNNSPCYIGEAGSGMLPHVKTAIREADAILAINVRFGEMTTDGYTLLDVPVPRQKLIHVHGSDRELGKIYIPTIGIQSGPNAFVQALRPVKGNWGEWKARGQTAFEKSFDLPPQPSPVDMGAVTAHLRSVLPPDAILTNGAGNFTVWPNKFYRYGPQARLLAPQSGAMGYGVPAAIAAKVAYPERTVVCFAGDGDFQMTLQELATARQADAAPIILIVNNGIYGTIRAHQERTFPARVSGTDMVNPDFPALARAYGFHSERVENTAEFAPAFARALASPTGAVLDLSVSPEALTPRQTLSQMRTAAVAAKS
jgi:acetolactate synthase-1/2/3 large subunit